MPAAARLGDMTTHGGVISSGASSVLIEGKAAARVGDSHLCPMLNPGPVPHVGGSIVTGVTNVLIEGSAAASVGALCQCVGPAANVAQAAVSVLIGGATRVSRGGQACLNDLLRCRQAQITSPASPAVGHFLDLRFRDDGAAPLAALPYSLRTKDRDIEYGELDSAGRLWRNNLPRAAHYCVRLQGVISISWDRDQAAPDDEVNLQLQFSDASLSLSCQIALYARYYNGRADLLRYLQASCEQGRIRQTWRIPATAQSRFPLRGYFFVLQHGSQRYCSPLLRLQHKLDIQLHQLPELAGYNLPIRFSDACRQLQRVDAQGRCQSDASAAGVYRFELPVEPPLFAE